MDRKIKDQINAEKNMKLENIGVTQQEYIYKDKSDHPYDKASEKVKMIQTRIRMDIFAAELRRYHVGERASATLWNAAIHDLEKADVIEKEGSKEITETLFVERYKCRREIQNNWYQCKIEKRIVA